MDRVVVVGNSGAGKSTLAREIAACIDAQHIELDAIYHQSDWQPLPKGQFQERVSAATGTGTGRWVSDGNYAAVRGLLWGRADTVIWLDYPRWLTTIRVIRRTIGRGIRREVLWNGNREDWRGMFRRRPEDNVVLWSIRAHGKTRAETAALAADPSHQHLTVHRLTSPTDAKALLRSIRRSTNPASTR